jgi:acyl-CoA dehydrogenase
MLQDLVAKFVDRELIPLEPAVLKREAETGRFRLMEEETAPLLAKCRELGLWGLDVPEEFGGANLPVQALMLAEEEMARTVTPFEIPPDSPNLHMMLAVASSWQRERYLEPYARGEAASCIAISEPGAGGDPAGMTTRAVPDGDDWVINGRKIWVSRVPQADFIILMARTGEGKRQEGVTAFIVERGTPGFVIEREIPMLGGHRTYEVVFENCRVPAQNLLADEGAGYRIALANLESGRINVAAQATGVATAALAAALSYARERRSMGKALIEHQAINFRLADMATGIEAARQLYLHAAALRDAAKPCIKEASMAKLFASEMAERVCSDAIQIHGGYGYVADFPVERLWRDVRVTQIYEGASDIQRLVIGRALQE